MSDPALCEPISAANAEHYTWGETGGEVCDGWHLVRAAGLSVIEERMPAGSNEQRHWHQRSRQFFYVLEGELTMAFDGRTVTLPPRHGIEIAPEIPHQARNSSDAETRFLVIFAAAEPRRPLVIREQAAARCPVAKICIF